jgi:hypothetical protein
VPQLFFQEHRLTVSKASPPVVGFGTDDEWDRENMTPSGL